MRIDTLNSTDYFAGFAVVAKWVEALHGHGQLNSAVDYLRDVAKADVAVMLRVSSEHKIPKKLTIADPTVRNLVPRRRVSFAEEIFGEFLPVMRRGTALLYSELAHEGEITIAQQMQINRRLNDFAVGDVCLISLGGTNRQADFLELHYSYEMPRDLYALFQKMGQTLATSWGARLPGIAHEAYLQTRSSPAHLSGNKEVAVLDATNPLELTRCEFRVCTLVREGLMTKAIAEALGVKVSTVRSHMHSIYLKAGVSGHVELLHLLASTPDSEPISKAS